MISVTIGGYKRKFSSVGDVDEEWINQQINRRHGDGRAVCVQVVIEEPPIDVQLTTPACSVMAGYGRQANPEEREVLQLWKKHGLDEEGFTGGNVIAFFKQLRRVIT